MTIREARKAKGMTLMQLSEATGIGYRQLQAVEVGDADPGNLAARNLLKIAFVLELDPWELLGINQEEA